MEPEAPERGPEGATTIKSAIGLNTLSVPECLCGKSIIIRQQQKWFLFHHIFIIQTFMSVKLQQILILPNHIMQLAKIYIFARVKLLTDEVSFQHFPKVMEF